ERDFSEAAWAKINRFVDEYPKVLKEFEELFNRNRIFIERTQGVGGISKERALAYRFTGPNLRAAGVDYDVRIQKPYCRYGEFDFKLPVGTTGDCYDRYLVRNEEMWQSISLIKQAIQKINDLK